MGQEEQEREHPEELRELARRVRMLAFALGEAEKKRLLTYADDLEDLASRLERRAHDGGS